MTSRLHAVIASEWTKLTSTRMFGVCVCTAFGLSVALTGWLAMVMASANEYCAQPGRHCRSQPLRPDALVSAAGMMGDGTVGPGLSILMVLAALIVSVDYRYKTIGTTFMVTPRRSIVLLAKMAIAVAVALVVGFVSIVCSAAAFWALGGTAAEAFHPMSELAFRTYATVTIVAMISAAIAVAVASLARSSVVAVTLLIAWPSIAEPLLASLPDIGPGLAPSLPFVNARNFIGLSGPDISWGWQVSGTYFLLVAVVLVVVAIVHQARTDVSTI